MSHTCSGLVVVHAYKKSGCQQSPVQQQCLVLPMSWHPSEVLKSRKIWFRSDESFQAVWLPIICYFECHAPSLHFKTWPLLFWQLCNFCYRLFHSDLQDPDLAEFTEQDSQQINLLLKSSLCVCHGTHNISQTVFPLWLCGGHPTFCWSISKSNSLSNKLKCWQYQGRHSEDLLFYFLMKICYLFYLFSRENFQMFTAHDLCQGVVRYRCCLQACGGESRQPASRDWHFQGAEAFSWQPRSWGSQFWNGGEVRSRCPQVFPGTAQSPEQMHTQHEPARAELAHCV